MKVIQNSSNPKWVIRELYKIKITSDCFIDEPPPPGLQGAMQLTFRKLGFDYYPVHRPGETDSISGCHSA